MPRGSSPIANIPGGNGGCGGSMVSLGPRDEKGRGEIWIKREIS